MIAIGRYLVFIIYMTGLTISDRYTISEEDKIKFLDDIVALHNKYREKHNVGPLERKLDLDSVAAQILNDKLTGKYNHDYDGYGKNNYSNKVRKSDVIGEAQRAYLKWHRNEIDHNYFFEPRDSNADEFTQIVWKDTKNIGISATWTRLGIDYLYEIQVVYFPRGNIVGEYRTNVLQRPTLSVTEIKYWKTLRLHTNLTQFENYILHLHNVERADHKVPLLERDKNLDRNAYFKLQYMETQLPHFHRMEGYNIIKRSYDNKTLLDIAEAEAIFSEWKNNGPNYNYSIESITHEADNFPKYLWSVTQKMGIAMFKGEGFYRVLVLYGFPDNIEEQLMLNIRSLRSMDQGESSSY